MLDNPDMADATDSYVASLSPVARHLLSTALSHRYDLVVRALSRRCVRCGRSTFAVALVHPDGAGSAVSGEVDAEAGMALAFAKELLEEAGHPAAATIKYRELGGERYLSSGCAGCDAIFDPFLLADAVAEVRERGEVGLLPVLVRGSRTIAEWALLSELVQTSAFDEF